MTSFFQIPGWLFQPWTSTTGTSSHILCSYFVAEYDVEVLPGYDK
ncbi:MAG: hypothetical protein NTV68_08095 [Methanomicrobiales archaeon]|nr:hypothetical protein [Methanomicrobiales archaeon]